jgi:pimeloyl-ACP methyl ester carboxylesterase
MDRLDVRGTHIAFRARGPASGGPSAAVLMTHGWAASSHMFGPNADVLATRHRVITWDLRGHGQSDAPSDAGAYSADLAVGDMLALLDHLEVDRAVLAGHSLGGFLSLQFQLAHPERVAGLVLIDTGPGYRNADARAGWNAMADGFADALDERGFAGHSGGPEFDPSVHRNGARGLALAARGTLTQHDASVIESLPSIAVPTLVIVGAKDRPFLNGSQYMAAKVEGAQLVIIDGAGHAPNVSHPEQFDDTVSSFLDRVATQLTGELDVH